MREFRKSLKLVAGVAFRPNFVRPKTSPSIIDQTKKKTSQRAKMFPMTGREATAVLKSWLRELSLRKGLEVSSDRGRGDSEARSLLNELESDGAEE